LLRLIALISCLPALAWAHPGHADPLSAALHPWTGVDHLVLLLGAGLYAARWPQKRTRAVAATVLIGFSVGLWLASAVGGVELALIEWLATVGAAVMLGLALGGERVAPSVAAVVTGLFALAHGWAHGAEFAGAGMGTSVAAIAGAASIVILGATAGLAIRSRRTA
jgi:urease accessory protein